ncbi:MAG: cell division protein FtsA [Bryobacterales bacterium]|nr:cell division protein FtsA [Bryobacteraceae bacterium]MDW8356022.1 cell division protein FtsA [Bryobacterales bacterium]
MRGAPGRVVLRSRKRRETRGVAGVIVAGIDAGSARTRCLVGCLSGVCLRLVGFGEAPGAGWSRGRVADAAALSESVRQAVEQAETRAGVAVESAVLGVGGPSIQAMVSQGLHPMGRPREVRAQDLRQAVEDACRVHLPADRMVLQVFPREFVLDGRVEYHNPVGAMGSRLESYVQVITASVYEHQALVAAANQAGVVVEETVFEAVAAAYAAVHPAERREGIAVVDVGLHSTELVAYAGDIVTHAATIPLGGDHLTRDVAHGFCVSYDDAARLKEECGCALAELAAANSVIALPCGPGRAPRQASRRELSMILEARAEELFWFIQRELAQAGLERSLFNGIVLCGGGAALNGMCDVAERVLHCRAQNGLPVGILDWPEELDHPAWTTAAGLLMYAARLKYRSAPRRNGGLLGGIFRRKE